MRNTRGKGLLENFLSRKRAVMADRLISDDLRGGRILDIGCGSYPFFLNNIKFKEKFGLDKELNGFDIEKSDKLPFNDNYFDVVTMLAVIEHFRPLVLNNLFLEVRRVLKKGGEFILTTPNYWTGAILNLFSKFGLISGEEVGEHKRLYKKDEIVDLLVKSGFERKKIVARVFEMGLNIWVKGKV